MTDPGRGDMDFEARDILGTMAVAGRDLTFQYVARPEPGIPYLAPDLPPKHVPRVDELAELRYLMIDEGREVGVTALRGMGGIGKTTLAIALCHDKRVIEAFPDGILWATLGPNADLTGAQQSWAVALGYPEDLKTILEPKDRAFVLRNWLHGKRCLLVIDDVWEAASLPHLRVGGEKSATLVTTRERAIAMEVGHERILGTLKPDQAVELLKSWAGDRAVGTDDEAAELARRLGYLPLALRLAGAQTMDGKSWARLLQHFRQEQIDLARLDHDQPDRERSLKRAFDLSLEHLPDALCEKFRLLGVFAAGRGAPFSAEAAAAVWEVEDVEDTRDDLGRLVRAALLDRIDPPFEGSENWYTLHLLLADYARAELDDDTRRTAEQRHHDHYLDIAENSKQEWQRADTALPQMRAAWERLPKDDLNGLWAWATAASIFFKRRGHSADNIAWAGALLTAVQTAGDRRKESWAENALGYTYDDLGRLDEALRHYEQSLAIHRELGDRAGEAVTLNNIGQIHRQRGELDEALRYYEQSLAIYRELSDRTDRAGEAVALNNIGTIHQQRGELDEALRHYEQSLAIYCEVGDRAGEATALNDIGQIRQQRGALDKALHHYEQSLAIRCELGDRSGEAVALNNIGTIHQQCGTPDEAMRHYEQSLTILCEVGDRVNEAITGYNLALIYRRQGRLAEAVALLENTVAIDEQIGHPDLESDRAMLEEVRADLRAQGE